MVKFKNGLISK